MADENDQGKRILGVGWYYVKYDDFSNPVGPFPDEVTANAHAQRDYPGGEYALVDVLFKNFAWGE